MRRAVTPIALGFALGLVAIVAAAVPAGAQQDENETGELDPGDLVTTTTLAEEPLDPGEVVVVDSTTPPLSPDSTVPIPTTLPPGCAPPLPPQAVFTARMIAADARTARFEIDDVRSGSLEGYRVEALVDVDFFDDTRYLELGRDYLVAVEIDPSTGRLHSKVKPTPLLFGGDQVVGVDDATVVCPEADDPIITRMIDGTSVETGILTPFFEDKRDLLWSFVRPALVVLAALVGLVLVKRMILWIVRRFRRAWTAHQGQPTRAPAASRRSSSTA
ncbi:MAG: hypothetical protein AB7J47_03205 [Acidimicrobiia bacterium]